MFESLSWFITVLCIKVGNDLTRTHSLFYIYLAEGLWSVPSENAPPAAKHDLAPDALG